MQRAERGKTIWSKTKTKKKEAITIAQGSSFVKLFFNLSFAFRFVFRHFILQPSFGSGRRSRKKGKDLMYAIIYKI